MANSRRLPPLNALRAFESVARLGSVKAAAEELFVTPSAVSRQVQSLEDYLGTQLLIRENRKVSLTETGQSYARSLIQHFEGLGRATDQLRREQDQNKLRLYVPLGIAQWIVERMSDFEAKHPDIDVIIDAHGGGFKCDVEKDAPEGTDITVVLGWQPQMPKNAWTMSPDFFNSVVCAPSLLERYGTPERPEDIAKLPWLINRAIEGGWQWWAYCAGAHGIKPKKSIYLNAYSTMMQACLDGQGAMIGHRSSGVDFMEDLVAEGRLCYAYPYFATSGTFGYYLLPNDQSEDSHSFNAFLDWLRANNALFSQRAPTPLEAWADEIILRRVGN